MDLTNPGPSLFIFSPSLVSALRAAGKTTCASCHMCSLGTIRSPGSPTTPPESANRAAIPFQLPAGPEPLPSIQHPASCIPHPASLGCALLSCSACGEGEARVGARGERKERRGPALLVPAAAFAPRSSPPASPARLQDGGFPGHLSVLHQLLPGAQLCLAAVQRHVYLPRCEYLGPLESFSV